MYGAVPLMDNTGFERRTLYELVNVILPCVCMKGKIYWRVKLYFWSIIKEICIIVVLCLLCLPACLPACMFAVRV